MDRASWFSASRRYGGRRRCVGSLGPASASRRAASACVSPVRERRADCSGRFGRRDRIRLVDHVAGGERRPGPSRVTGARRAPTRCRGARSPCRPRLPRTTMSADGARATRASTGWSSSALDARGASHRLAPGAREPRRQLPRGLECHARSRPDDPSTPQTIARREGLTVTRRRAMRTEQGAAWRRSPETPPRHDVRLLGDGRVSRRRRASPHASSSSRRRDGVTSPFTNRVSARSPRIALASARASRASCSSSSATRTASNPVQTASTRWHGLTA